MPTATTKGLSAASKFWYGTMEGGGIPIRPVSLPLVRYSWPRLAESQPKGGPKSGTSMRAPSPVTLRRWRAARMAFDADRPHTMSAINPDLRRFTSRLALDAHDAAPGLHPKVVARTVLLQISGPARDGAVDQIWIRSFQLSYPRPSFPGPRASSFRSPRRPRPPASLPLEPFLVFQVDPIERLLRLMERK